MCGHSFRATHSLSSTHNAAGFGKKMFTRMLFWFTNCFVCLPPAWGVQSWSYKWGNDSDVNRESRGVCLLPSLIVLRLGGDSLLAAQSGKQEGQVTTDHILCQIAEEAAYSSVFIHVVGNVGRKIKHFNLCGHVNTGNLIQRDKKCVENKEFRLIVFGTINQIGKTWFW